MEMRGGVTDAGQPTNRQTLKIELLSQWKLKAEFRNFDRHNNKIDDNDDDDDYHGRYDDNDYHGHWS